MSAGAPSPALAQGLASGAEALGLELSHEQQAQLLRYLGLIEKWNRVYNLTAIRRPDEMLTHHLLDSLAVVPPLRRHLGGAAARLLDVGSGGGLPGVVLAVCLPELTVTCVDAVAKKATFVRQVAAELGLKNLKAEHARIEDLPAAGAQVVSSRAFASLPDMTSLTSQHLSPNGVWMAMKGKRPDEEIDALGLAVGVFHVEQLTVPGLDAERCLVWLRPISG
ncbi:16S rRNA (guanine(527)-N(7))-methyltransferase RsmG [Eleftheria terrae]|uniref:16S rRNA (guanine(527)-N(7))-methyltransferase RsmG n=1 Tax=Eleftheria terrae TaxID=1597781 RepID=UPI00263B0B2E|nr:16S rRNA (guanine(527)-N(7))-methyltransferase RsmG [Eleftheria terrae]WKB51243.1 16S rRNA (guanine(527)-N(7))-methyltransferase RsmG [Eleftheria terrae]